MTATAAAADDGAGPEPVAPRLVYPLREVDPADATRFGGKGAGLARMWRAGIAVPPAFVISTEAYQRYQEGGGVLAPALLDEIDDALAALEEETGLRFGAPDGSPLLVSVRSGAAVSMPGMMDTVLNLGLDAAAALVLATDSGDAAFALDTWLRFWRMFAEIVLQVDADELLDAVAGAAQVARADANLASFVAVEAGLVAHLDSRGVSVGLHPREHLRRAVQAVFDSWDSRRARAYRQHHGIADDLGTAVAVQAMVFGNRGPTSGSGVAFTRDPNTGERLLYGEYLTGRQGEDIVSGDATPVPLSHPDGLAPVLQEQLEAWASTLEVLYGDAVDIEFTVERGRLYLLQVRAAKRTAAAAVKIANDLVAEGILTPEQAVTRVSLAQLRRLLRPSFDLAALERAEVLVSGVGSSPGHASGQAILDADRAVTSAAGGTPVILVRPTTSPQDIRGMLAAEGIVTGRGGALSHAAVVSRALDKPCVVGCESLTIDPEAKVFGTASRLFDEGVPISIDGGTGLIYVGSLPYQVAHHDTAEVDRLLAFADKVSGGHYWLGAATAGTASVSAEPGPTHPAGLGPVALTDLLIAAGGLQALIDAIDELSQDPQRVAAQDRLTRLAHEAAGRLLGGATIPRVDIRLPNLASPRAQQLISSWVGLAPQLFLPVGMRSFYRPLLQGIGAAAEASGHGGVTAVMGGVTDVRELYALRQAAADVGPIGVGASLQSVSALLSAKDLVGEGFPVWVHIREIIRTFFGFPSTLFLALDVLDSYVEAGNMAHNPSTRLSEHLRGVLEALVSATAAARSTSGSTRLGADCADGVALTLIEDLYAVGFRTFSVPHSQFASVRLALSQFQQGVRP